MEILDSSWPHITFWDYS